MQRRPLNTSSLWVVLLATHVCSLAALAQKPEYEFYYKFRTEFQPKLQETHHWSLAKEEIIEAYAASLTKDGIPGSEIARRIKLLRSEQNTLDADYYSRYYLDPDSNFNHEPNAFLMEVVKPRKPGVALDYGMGQGRNSTMIS